MLDARARLFSVLVALFITTLVLGDLIGVKLLEFTFFGQPFVVSIGLLPFPVTFLITDLVNEFYGKKAARFLTLVGLAMALLTFFLVFVAVAIPGAAFTEEASWNGTTPAAFRNVFGGSQRILAASMVAYLVSQLTDIAVFHAIRKITRERFLFLRATGSTAVSQLVDTVVIQTLAWWGLLSIERIASIVVTSYLVKLAVAVGLTPLIYLGHAVVARILGVHAEEKVQPSA